MARVIRLTKEVRGERTQYRENERVWKRQLKLRNETAAVDEEKTIKAMQSAKAVLKISDGRDSEFFR
jgi:hypothetical protein